MSVAQSMPSTPTPTSSSISLCYRTMPVAAWLNEEILQSIAPSYHDRSDTISYWLSHTPSPPPLPLKPDRKRIRDDDIPDAPNSMSSRDSFPSKRRRIEDLAPAACPIRDGDDNDDIQDTPRAKSNVTIPPPSPSSFNSSHTSRSSVYYGMRSPKKKQAIRKMADLSLLPHPVLMRSFEDGTRAPPDELDAVCKRLRRISRGMHIIGRSEKVSRPVTPLLAMLTGLAGIGCDRFDFLGQVDFSDSRRRVCVCG
jgi:hypothetical protein